MSNFRVGQKVVCVDARDIALGDGTAGFLWKGTVPLTKGSVYTVAHCQIHPFTEDPVIVLREVPIRSSDDYGYFVGRFRPVISQSDDIALFHALCPGLPVVPPAILKPRIRVK